MENKKLRGVMGIIEKDGKYLFGIESKNSPIKGKWRLIGGKLEGYETSEQAMRREALEETGMEIEVEEFLGTTQGSHRPIDIDIVYARHVSGEPCAKLDEFSQLGWFSFEETHLMDIEPLSRCMFYLYRANKQIRREMRAEQ